MSGEPDEYSKRGEGAVIPLVSIVGLPNVGKSTLFNRLVGGRRAIVHESPGVTRDRNVAEVEWRGRRFLLADTGGLMAPGSDDLAREVENQVRHAIAESDLIIFLVDGRSGVSPVDGDIANLLRKEDCEVILVANKVERSEDESAYHLYGAVGLGEPVPVSAQRGINCGDLLDRIVESLPPAVGVEGDQVDALKVAVIGRPNAGKSSLINRILGEDRLVVHHEAGTTRDAIDTRIEYRGQPVILIDTAGMRRKSRIEEDLEYYANVRVIRSIERADVVVLLIDSVEGIVRQDMNILSLVEKRGKGMMVALSKWDRIDTDREVYAESLREAIPHFIHVPIVFTSAVTGEGVWTVLDRALEVRIAWSKRVPTPLLNRLLGQALDRRSPPSMGTRPIKLFYISQVGTSPPVFVLFSSSPKGVKSDYKRYLENFLREHLELDGVPIRIKYRQRKRESRVRE